LPVPIPVHETIVEVVVLTTSQLALHLLKSCTEAIRCVPQIVMHAVVEKGMEYKEQRLALVET